MITLRRTDDQYDNYIVDIEQDNPEGKWKLSLLTQDLSPQFINNDNRIVDISIVDIDDINRTGDHVLYLPVKMVCVVYLKDKIKIYYAPMNSLNGLHGPNVGMTLAGYIFVDDIDDLIGEPYIRLEFKVVQADAVDNQEGVDRQNINQQSPSGIDSSQQGSGHIHIDENQNANGGLDIPVGEQIPESRRSVEHT